MHLVWFAQAEERNPIAAIEQNLLVEQAIEKLADFPFLGKVGRRTGTRELVIPSTSFIAVYRIDSNLDEIQILRILHARQKYPPE